MKLALVSFLAAVVAAPLTAEAAEAPTRWSVLLDGRIVETLSVVQATEIEDCRITRLSETRRVTTFRSRRATAIAVSRLGGRAAYRPSRIARVRVGVVTSGRWSERRICRAAPIETTSGRCGPARVPPRTRRLGFRWAGPNRISFARSAHTPVRLCGLDRTTSSDAGLGLAPGRVDEELLIRGARRRVVARCDTTRNATIGEGTKTAVGQEVRVTWNLTFRR